MSSTSVCHEAEQSEGISENLLILTSQAKELKDNVWMALCWELINV